MDPRRRGEVRQLKHEPDGVKHRAFSIGMVLACTSMIRKQVTFTDERSQRLSQVGLHKRKRHLRVAFLWGLSPSDLLPGS